ncbi:MAG: hypothetical protein M0Z75_07185 [Nitrospiraceae bacterium]|nr:hypothetical protein [Nitrospiraceae bacterium]
MIQIAEKKRKDFLREKPKSIWLKELDPIKMPIGSASLIVTRRAMTFSMKAVYEIVIQAGEKKQDSGYIITC